MRQTTIFDSSENFSTNIYIWTCFADTYLQCLFIFSIFDSYNIISSWRMQTFKYWIVFLKFTFSNAKNVIYIAGLNSADM